MRSSWDSVLEKKYDSRFYVLLAIQHFCFIDFFAPISSMVHCPVHLPSGFGNWYCLVSPLQQLVRRTSDYRLVTVWDWNNEPIRRHLPMCDFLAKTLISLSSLLAFLSRCLFLFFPIFRTALIFVSLSFLTN